MLETLDQSDIDALMNAAAAEQTTEDVDTPQIFSRFRRDFEDLEIKEYDFKRPERISKDQMRALQSLHETFARNLSAALSGFLRTIVEVRVAHAEQMTYSEFNASLPNPTCFNLINADGLDGQMCLELSPLVIYPIIDRLLGGSCADLFIPQREMTQIECRLIQKILSRAMTAFTEAWEGVRDLTFSLGDMESNPQIVQIVPPNEVVIVIGFEIKLASRAGTMSLCIPFKVIEPLIDDLSAQSWAQVGHHDGDWECMLAAQLGGAALQITGVLAETSISMRDLGRLEVGDVLTTEKPSSQPIVVEVTGQPKMMASMGQFKGKRALRITSLTNPAERA